jgi:transcriptional regulator with XRE-family HTH domain
MARGARPKRRGRQLADVIARHVEALRIERGLSKRELASRAEVSITGLNLIEAAAVKPTVETLERLAAVLQVAPAALLDEGRDAQVPQSPKLFFRVMRRLKDRDTEYLLVVDRLLQALDRFGRSSRR